MFAHRHIDIVIMCERRIMHLMLTNVFFYIKTIGLLHLDEI